MKRLGKILGVIAAILLVAFLIFRVPDTDPAEMRDKYGGAPSQFVRVATGAVIHLRDEGPQDGLPIVLLHGSNADLHTWQPWAEALKGDYRVIRFDQVGHGLTGSDPQGDYTIEGYVADIDAIAERLGLDRFVLAGNSMGGSHTVAYAMAHPERLLGMVLVDPGGAPINRDGGGNLAFKLAAMPGVGSFMSQFLPRSLVERSLSQSVSNQAVVTPEAVDRYWELARYPGNREATRIRFNRGWKAFDAGDIGAIGVPTLILWGTEDRLIPVEAGRWFDKHLPNSTLIEYEGIGHLPQEEAADRSARDLRNWLATAPLSNEQQ
ncbi:alpha/beta hydrolase [Altererythrobacter arenosus]|uniref:Alpha/beta hydrolase n=1 Tax=Altererythrobacter arenosus TaxID=3032592 RepID=A0ABY8FXB4_9SPHN|nr:alpha/beta hydrolase [Altererythrobacter sp. CAU 1644]WFL77886.1 alpha/beta hydrolase [Altererythrobacter sp. CAU 1644]